MLELSRGRIPKLVCKWKSGLVKLASDEEATRKVYAERRGAPTMSIIMMMMMRITFVRHIQVVCEKNNMKEQAGITSEPGEVPNERGRNTLLDLQQTPVVRRTKRSNPSVKKCQHGV
ncbi:hypothetical protein PVNG_00920 [Plasmodium vivax North Korean]|uniref:Uncharacterized protein n=1 Tax=Plasmodium vivax North Korean TaxID=1035514 RepID=A0A0J9TTG1_PLAVI|nr:hypothetical protein PVNG_00920 [Plasmodium vivax North Korean]